MKTTVHAAGKVQVIGLSGKLVLGMTDGFEQAVKNLLADQQTRILVDLRHVPYMDSSGIGEIAAAKKRAKQKGASLKLLKSKTQFDLSVEFMLNLMYPGEIFDDEREALESF